MSSTLKHRVRANAGERRKRLSVELSWRPVTAYVDWVTLGRSECLSGVEGRRRAMLKHSTRSRVARSRATPSYRVLVIRMTSSVPAGARWEVSALLVWSAVFGAPASRTCSGRTGTRSLGPLTLCLSFSVFALEIHTFFGKRVTAADDGWPWRPHALGACQG